MRHSRPVPTACLYILTSLLHLLLRPQTMEFNIQDHGSSSGKLCAVLGSLLVGFRLIYSLHYVFEHL